MQQLVLTIPCKQTESISIQEVASISGLLKLRCLTQLSTHHLLLFIFKPGMYFSYGLGAWVVRHSFSMQHKMLR